MSPSLFTKEVVEKAIKKRQRAEKKKAKWDDYYSKLMSGEIPIDEVKQQ